MGNLDTEPNAGIHHVIPQRSNLSHPNQQALVLICAIRKAEIIPSSYPDLQARVSPECALPAPVPAVLERIDDHICDLGGFAIRTSSSTWCDIVCLRLPANGRTRAVGGWRNMKEVQKIGLEEVGEDGIGSRASVVDCIAAVACCDD